MAEIHRVWLSLLVYDKRTGETNPQKNVEHWPPKACAEAHDGRERRDGKVRNKVGERVADSEDCESNDRIRESEEEAERLRHG